MYEVGQEHKLVILATIIFRIKVSFYLEKVPVPIILEPQSSLSLSDVASKTLYDRWVFYWRYKYIEM